MLLDTIGQWQNPSEPLKLLFDQVNNSKKSKKKKKMFIHFYLFYRLLMDIVDY